MSQAGKLGKTGVGCVFSTVRYYTTTVKCLTGNTPTHSIEQRLSAVETRLGVCLLFFNPIEISKSE